MASIKVSIIIPVYNMEGYVAKTLQSCVDQSFRNIEILVINDGSTDGSEKEIIPYLEDKRVKLFNQENSGVSAARNWGIKNATGDYLTFLDGDDTLELNTIAEFVKVATKPGFDYKWTFFPVVRILEDGTEIQEIRHDIMPSYKFREEKIYTCREAFLEMGSRKLPVCVGGVFYKTDFITPTFINGRFEDSYMIYDMLVKNENILVIPNGCYRYLHRSGSFINSVWTPEKWRDYVRIQLKILDTEMRLFPSHIKKIIRHRSRMRYNLRYLKFKNRRNSYYSLPLDFFDSKISQVKFNFRDWLIMIIKCCLSEVKFSLISRKVKRN